jgi:hypothetical protein
MKFTPLSPTQREQFDAEGFLIVRNALGKDEIARLIDGLNPIEQQFLGAWYREHDV